jgi:hypothetical protein
VRRITKAQIKLATPTIEKATLSFLNTYELLRGMKQSV